MNTRTEIGIVDTRNIIKTLKEQFDYNFKNYALTFFKRRLEYIISKYNLKDADNFIRRITNDKDFFEIFLKEICIETTEMFRDPSLWRYLKDDFFPKTLSNVQKYKIWFPEVNSGEDLYSLLILLKELNFLDKVQIIVSSLSQIHLNKIKDGYFDYNKLEANEANFSRVFREKELKSYYTVKNEHAYIDISLLNNIQYTKQNAIFEEYPKGIKLIICRNQMLYYNQILEERLLKTFNTCLIPGGHLVVGMNEKIDYWNSDKDYILVDKNENIYKKKVS
ncbi:MAG: CheR family methyltransferase [Bacteroidales bacterium]